MECPIKYHLYTLAIVIVGSYSILVVLPWAVQLERDKLKMRKKVIKLYCELIISLFYEISTFIACEINKSLNKIAAFHSPYK